MTCCQKESLRCAKMLLRRARMLEVQARSLMSHEDREAYMVEMACEKKAIAIVLRNCARACLRPDKDLDEQEREDFSKALGYF